MSIDINSQGDVTVGGDVVGRDKITNVTNYYRAPDWAEARHQRNRQVMIQNVRNFWIKGVLENSLYSSVLLQLGLEYKPEAVEQPWNLVLRRAEQPDQPLTAGAHIIEVFDEAGGALLILGAPGSGKTTTLLELARDLLTRAEKDGTAPIPVVFSLSSWAEQRPPLADWLVEELFRRYDVPRKVGKVWIKQDMVLPLLDGLDEVQAEHRDSCAQVINAFHAEHGLTPLVVCSRIADYEALNTRVRLRVPIVLQSLTPEQIDDHLAKLGPKAVTIQSLLAVDKGLREMAATPLLLSVMLIAYQDANAQEVAALQSVDEQRAHLFERYVHRMLERPAELRVYTPVQSQPGQGSKRTKMIYSTQESLLWLAWLAGSMKRYSQSVYYLEWMQVDWLPSLVQQKTVARGVAIVSGLVGWLVFGLGVGLSTELGVGLSTGLGLVIGLMIGFGVRVLVGPVPRPRGYRTMESAEIIHWSWSNALKGLGVGLVYALVSGLVLVLVFGLVFGLIFGLAAGLGDGLMVGLIFGLLVGPVCVLVCVVNFGLDSGHLTLRRVPNEGMRRTARSALIVGLGVEVVGGLIGGLIGGLVGELVGGLVVGLVVGLIPALLFGQIYGGQVYLLHVTLRLLLWRNGSTPPPWEYVRFLDYCAERVLLRKVGGGYIFIHRLLMDYFAELEQ